MRSYVSLAAIGVILAVPVLARAGEPERAVPTQGAANSIPIGVTGQGLLGGGIDNRFGMAEGGRIGYSFDSGLYLGGSVTRYDREQAASTWLVGGDAGIRLAPARDWEVRPYAFMGAALDRPGDVPRVPSENRFALQPGVLLARHFGPFYVSGEGRLLVVPSPAALSVLAGAGLTF